VTLAQLMMKKNRKQVISNCAGGACTNEPNETKTGEAVHKPLRYLILGQNHF
jgi:hypothetical protein